jgi:glycosyltransferase involved in cell wall biosynthesis
MVKQKIVFFMANLMSAGAERVTVNIMKQLDKERFEIFLVMVSREGTLLKEVPAYITIIDLNVKKTLFSILKFRSVVKEIKPDIIYSTMTHTTIAQYLALLGMKRKPLRVLRNATSPKLLTMEKSLNTLWRFFLKKAYKSADKVLAQTPEMKEEISKYYDTPNNQIDVFVNPIEENEIREKIANVVNPFDENSINVVAAGRLTHAKAFDVLLEAFKTVVEKDSRFKLYIIGRDDGEEETLKALQKELKLEKHIFFLGFQSNPYQYYHFSDLFVLSSRREGLPNAVLENLYLRKPIIATRCVPFLSSLIHNGVNGFLTEVENGQELAFRILEFNTLSKLGFDEAYQPTNSSQYFKSLEKSHV